MKAVVLIFIVIQLDLTVAQASEKARCQPKESIVTEYLQWKKDFHKFLSKYDNLNAFERFSESKNALKEILGKMQMFSEKTMVPLPESTFGRAKGLLGEIEAERMARHTANPILKSSLQTLENSMEEMISKAQWANPNCKLDK